MPSRLTKKRLAAMAVVATSLMLGLPATSQAAYDREEFNASAQGGRVIGFMKAKNDRVKWDFRIKDIESDGHCVYADVQIDRNNYPDPEFDSPTICGKGEDGTFRDAEYGGLWTRGGRIKICSARTFVDPCSTVVYVPE